MLKFFISLNSLLLLFFWWAFYVRYWQFRELFDEGARYYDGEEVHIMGGGFWVLLAIFLLIIAMILIYFYRKKSN